jgi:hypothetical protein
MKTTINVSWPDLGAPESVLNISYGEEQQSTMKFLLAEGNGLKIALNKVKLWQNKPRPKDSVLIHQSDIHSTYAEFGRFTVNITFQLKSSLDDIERASWMSPKECPQLGEWISGPTTGGQPVRVMGHYVGKNGCRNVIFCFSGRKEIGREGTSIALPRLTIGTLYARDFA